MYVRLDREVDAVRLEALRLLLDYFDIRRCSGASKFTASTYTIARYWPALREVFPEPWVKASLVVLNAQQQIPVHVDPPIPNQRRFHLPLLTSADAWCFHDGTWQQLAAGVAYEMDPTRPHGAVNWGQSERIHLVIDVGEARPA